MFLQTWLLPISFMVAAGLLAFPLSRYFAWIMDAKYRPLPVFGWFEKHLDSGPQNWKQYAGSLLVFNTLLFVFGYLVLMLQQWMPLNPDSRVMLAPSTIFNSVISFMTNTNLQHYSGDQHLSNFSQIFFCISQYVSFGSHRLLCTDWDHHGPCAATPLSATSSWTCGGC